MKKMVELQIDNKPEKTKKNEIEEVLASTIANEIIRLQ
jgi:phosphoribosylformylglycinamidine (FGAM) synthase PurS component